MAQKVGNGTVGNGKSNVGESNVGMAQKVRGDWVIWVLLGLMLVGAFLPNEGLNPVLALIFGEVPFIVALLHMAFWATWRYALISFAIVYLVAFTFEATGVATGLVFGNYFYSETAIGPLLLGVPLLLPLGYFSFAYPALYISRIMIGRVRAPVRGVAVVTVALLSALVMTLIDLATDPIESTLLNKWTWEDGGAYVGVPLQNYFGWLATTFTFFVLINLVLSRASAAAAISRPRPVSFEIQPVLMYVLIGLPSVLNPLLGRDDDIYLAMSLVAILAMSVPAVVALFNLRGVQNR
jgi:putative membrane protein